MPARTSICHHQRLHFNTRPCFQLITKSSVGYRAVVVGRENLPSVETSAVYVANHASYLDIYSLFHLRRPFKFISKVGRCRLNP